MSKTFTIQVTKQAGGMAIVADTSNCEFDSKDMFSLIHDCLPRLMFSMAQSLCDKMPEPIRTKVVNSIVVNMANAVIKAADMTDEQYDEALKFAEDISNNACICGKCDKDSSCNKDEKDH